MTKEFSINIWLILVLVFFITTRFYKINEIPSSLYWDEASIGYNAYSILKTGSDEWGQLFPIHFKAFGEYKLPVYIYSVVPFIAVSGLNEWSVRLPAVLFSFGSILLIYFIAAKLTGKKSIGNLSAFFLSISPWFFIFSRTGYEATAGLAFYLLGIYLVLKIPKGGRFLIWSTISFVLSAYSYNSFRIIIPLTIITLVILFFTRIKKVWRKNLSYIGLSIILILISSLPIFNLILNGGEERLREVGIFSQRVGKKDVIINFSKNYLSHFTSQFLFKGDNNLRSQQNGFGQIYYLDLLLLLTGIFFLVKSKEKKYWLILVLALLGPIPASITKESPHALRSISIVPFLCMLSGLGFYWISTKIKFKPLLLIAFLTYLIFFGNYLYNFLTVYPKQSAADWQYGYKAVFKNYAVEFNSFDTILISDMYSQPYIFALNYLSYPPDKFRNEVLYNTTIRKETSLVKKIDKFQFSSIDFNNLPKGKTLIFADPNEKLTEIHYQDTINNPDGSIAFYVYEYEK